MTRSLIGLLLGVGACSNDYATGTELWAADLLLTEQVLVITLVRDGDELNGTGLLSFLNSTTGDALTLFGTRRFDTVDITLSRGDADPFRFVGWYMERGTLDGKLDGGGFVNQSIVFKRR